MSPLRTALREGKTWWLQQFAAHPVQSALTSPVISISFDDVPLSAYRNGLPILDAAGIKATFYVCLGIDPPGVQEHLGPEEIAHLRTTGHEIGCHTFSHYRLSSGSTDEMARDTARNRAALAPILEGVAPQSFSFPFGHLSFAAKDRLAPHYNTLRSTRHGVNAGRIDLNCLKAVPLYEGQTTEAVIDGWLDRAEESRGWLLLYTHGVTEAPGRFDISPRLFESLLNRCRARGWPMLPVAQAAALARGARTT